MPEPTAPGAPRPVTPLGIAAGLIDDAAVRLGELADSDVELDGQLSTARADLDRALRLVGGLDPYVAEHTSPPSPELDALQQRTAGEDWRRRTRDAGIHLEQEMLSGHVEGAFLGLLVRITGARRVLEVGMFTGYSALAMAQALPADGRLVACEIDPGVADFARESFAASAAGDRIDVEVGPAADTLARLARAGERFDLVFVDADKTGYADYVALLLGDDADGPAGAPASGGLLAPGGLIALDNTLLQGEPWADGQEASDNGRAVARLNTALAADPRVEQVLVPLRDGLTLVRRVDGA